MEKKIDVLVVEPGLEPRLVQAQNTMEAFEEIVGGPVEMGYMPSMRAVLFYSGAEDGQEWGKVPLSGVSGTFLLCGYRNSRRTSLSPSQEVLFRRWSAQMSE